jgi:hypothetical protein
MTLLPIPSEFPYIWRKFSFLFYQCTIPYPGLRLWLNMSISWLFLSRQNSRGGKKRAGNWHSAIVYIYIYIAAGWLIVEKERLKIGSVAWRVLLFQIQLSQVRFPAHPIKNKTYFQICSCSCRPRANIVAVFTHKNEEKKTFKSKM